MKKAALFDLDGVVFDTEPQYTVFWGQICREYHPEIPDLEYKIKGQTLTQIYDRFFSGQDEEQKVITQRLNEFESNMKFNYVEGFEEFIHSLRQKGVKTAVVTSSNCEKMESVYRQRPEFKSLFDAILTSEDFEESKPSPDCYLKGAARFGVKPEDCVVFEDSFNGLKSGRASGAYVVGLATTNPAEAIAPYADQVINDFTQFIIHNS
jgi:HAD superfamily hydrolase (TIGR01509 family)